MTTFYVNQDAMENLSSEAAKLVAEKYGLSIEATTTAIALFLADKLRYDEYEESEIPQLKELEQAGLGYFGD